MTTIHWVNTADDMATLCQRLMNAPAVMLDTEFIREKTYRPEPCLLQLSICPNEAYLLDLHILLQQHHTQWQPLHQLLVYPHTVKVFHAARQDIELLWHSFGMIPQPLFDTQIVASVCGVGEDLSYAALVHKICGVLPDKSQRLTDWKQRPLDDEQMLYAAADVTYLHAVYQYLQNLPTYHTRQAFIAEETAPLLQENTYRSAPDQAWRKLRLRHETTQTMAAVRSLCAHRERMAEQQNISRNTLLRDDALVEVARQRPVTISDLKSVRYLSKNLSDELCAMIFAALDEAAHSPIDLPCPPETEAFSAQQQNTIHMLQCIIKILAQQDHVPLRLYTGNADIQSIEKLVLNNAQSLLLQEPRYSYIGQSLQQLIHGHAVLQCVDGLWSIDERVPIA